jgi:hypothetical protein
LHQLFGLATEQHPTQFIDQQRQSLDLLHVAVFFPLAADRARF